MSKQRLLFITTGGTIASVRTQQGLKPVLSSEDPLPFYIINHGTDQY